MSTAETPPGTAGRATAETDAPYWLALLIGILLVTPVGVPPAPVLAVMLVLVPLLGVSLRWHVRPAVVLTLLAAGIALRVLLFGTGFSGVLATTSAAIDRVLAGGNPYGIGYQIPEAPGQPFPYGPLALLWYLPFRAEPRTLEMAVSLAILAVLALRGRPIGLAIYALAPWLISLSSDGSNDTSAGLFLLVALLAAQRLAVPGGFLLAVATAFKPHAAAWLPALAWFTGLPGLAGFVAGSFLFWVPVLLVWGLGSVLASLRLANEIHQTPFYSLAAAVEGLTGRRVSPEPFDRLRLVLGALTAAVTTPFVRSGRAMVLAGTLVFLATLYAAYWSTFAYFAALAPVLCWHLDDWLGLGDRRVRWPGDPVGRMTEAIDRRWPLIETKAQRSRGATAVTRTTD
ncbi:MAG: hypothetical protein M3301_07300 [Chloroflexota bacterium]|nr:hypothetical protein [Chloroflexota bacterium]